ncbi:MAG: nucleotide-binding protein [Planctomycetota bacterium]
MNRQNPKLIAYERLQELLVEADSATYAWSSSKKATEWRQMVSSALRRLEGEESHHLRSFNHIQYGPMMFSASTPDYVFNDAFMSGIRNAQAIIRSALKEYEDYEMNVDLDETTSVDGTNDGELSRKIFVVHGHDTEMKESVARFLERLDFEAIILHEQASGGDTIIEKFERNSDVSYAVVLFSPDDVGSTASNPEDLKPRARQNVVLELGYFIGRLGRSHVCPLVRDSIEIPSDFHGVVYVPFDGETWKLHLVKELKHLGFDIDANKAF